jgi:hypothetical protein
VIHCCTIITKALDKYCNLKAIEITEANNFSNEDIGKLIDALIDNQQGELKIMSSSYTIAPVFFIKR